MLELAAGDEGFAAEVGAEIERLEKLLDDLELKALLNGPHDAYGAIISINARDGGTDANDWAEMLLRMYMQWAQKNDYDGRRARPPGQRRGRHQQRHRSPSAARWPTAI